MNAMVEQDTIVAISTPVGRGGIGIVRLSGPDARRIVGPLVRLRREMAAGRARVGVVLDVAPMESGIGSDPTHDAIEPHHEWGTRREGVGGGEAKTKAESDPCGMTGEEGEDRSRFPSGMTNKGMTDKETKAEADPCGMTNRNADEEAEPRVLDEAVVTFFAGPKSYTGEDVVEIAVHGAPVLLEYLVRQCCAGGARLAEPGEFTQRAFLAGRIDLTQAEAVGDLIGSSTIEQARVAARQMGGALSREVSGPKELLVGLIAAMEAGIDFAEDDIDILPAEKIAGDIVAVREPLAGLERSFAYGRVVREGFRLAIVGRPNAGKSSLFNRLVERERAIVTATPGTTRDLVTETVAIGGIPVELVDTAGLRSGEAVGEAERMGIAKSREAMAEADVVVLVVDSTADWGEEDSAVLDEFAAGGRRGIVAWNKSDLVGGEESGRPVRLRSGLDNPPFAEDAKDGPPDLEDGPPGAGAKDCVVTSHVSESRHGAPNFVHGMTEVRTSAVTGAGIGELREAILEAVGGQGGVVGEAGMLTNLRQHQAVTRALAGLDKARDAVETGTPHEMVLLDLYEGLGGLDALTGVTTSEDVLQLIFSRFCIGK